MTSALVLVDGHNSHWPDRQVSTLNLVSGSFCQHQPGSADKTAPEDGPPEATCSKGGPCSACNAAFYAEVILAIASSARRQSAACRSGRSRIADPRHSPEPTAFPPP